ncbi:MAG: hypothetical protein QN203_13600 [Armatimonadota bacterium]|nr:hypothetical protein [Armatimonadota bacterium]
MDERRTLQIDRIAYAADWLVRARQRVEDGDPARGLLALLLAQAEVRRATDAGLAGLLPPRRVERDALLLVASVAAVLAASAIVLATGLAQIASLPPEVPLPMVRLPQPAETMLQIVQTAPPAPERTVRGIALRPAPVPAPAAPAAPPAAASRLPAAPSVSIAPVAVPAAPVASSAPAAAAPAGAAPGPTIAAPAPPSVLSEADLIDLVLAAERSLRRTVNQ